MVTITRVAPPPGKLRGILALVAVGLPLPWLFSLVVLSLVVQAHPTGVSGTYGSEYWTYGLLASAGLLFFPILYLVAIGLGIAAVQSPRKAGKTMGWITIGVVIVSIPLLWLGYAVWIGLH